MGVCQLLVHGCRLPVKRLRRQGAAVESGEVAGPEKGNKAR